jgi:hypothetical protein
MRIGETFELDGKTYRAEAEVDYKCTGCAFDESAALCEKAGPCDSIIFVRAPAPVPDYSPILAGILAGKRIQAIRPDGTYADQQDAAATYKSMAALVPAYWLRVKPDTWVVNGVELPAPYEIPPTSAEMPTSDYHVLVGYGATYRAIESRRFRCTNADDAKALYDAITSTLPKAPAP